MTTYTEDLCVGGIATANSSWSSWVPASAFDNNNDTGWHYNDSKPAAILQYQFTSQKIIKKYTIQSRIGPYSYQSPTTFIIQGSNNAINWLDLDSRFELVWINSEKKEFTFENNTSYLYYRLYIPNADQISIMEMEMMEEVVQTPKPLNSIYNIGHRGNLRGKAKQGFVRPTIKEFFTSTNYLPTNKS